jgi:hypothetical protein
LPPWDAGREIAHLVRREIGRDSGALTDADLSNLLGVSSDTFCPVGGHADLVGLGVRVPSVSQIILHFRKRHRSGRRFEAARFLAEHITATNEDCWLPLTDWSSARQKLQRSFAAELLAPIEDLKDFIGTSGTTERLDEAGDIYGVSPLAIRSQLANHGLLAPEDVAI